MKLVKKSNGLTKRIQRMLKNESGNMAMMFGFLAPVMGMAMGLGIDTARLTNEQVAFHASVDAAALAIASDARSANTDPANVTTLKTYAQNYIKANYLPSNANATNVQVSELSIVGQTVTLKATAEYPTAFAKFVGVTTYNLSSESEAKRNGDNGVELVLVMDTTGSMGQSNGGSATKMDAAKAAAKNLLKTIYGGTLASVPDNANIRISVVPFAAGVRLNKSASDFKLSWIDTTQANPISAGKTITYTYDRRGNVTGSTTTNYNKYTGSSWAGCVEARAGGTSNVNTNYNENDVAPSTSSPSTLFPAYYNPDNSDRTKNCATAAIVPMTYSRANVEAGIDAMSASGSTLIPEGINWGWRAISPTEPLTKVEASGNNVAANISAYNPSDIAPTDGSKKWKKVMILMTDGDNALQSGTHNGSESTDYSSYDYSNEPSLAKNRFGQVISGSNSSTTALGVLDAVTLRSCTHVKDTGVELYVAGFGTGISGTSLANLQACATDTTHYVHATTDTALNAFFQEIANDINNSQIYVSK
jgi:Flp pilus assembly protein TadG